MSVSSIPNIPCGAATPEWAVCNCSLPCKEFYIIARKHAEMFGAGNGWVGGFSKRQTRLARQRSAAAESEGKSERGAASAEWTVPTDRSNSTNHTNSATQSPTHSLTRSLTPFLTRSQTHSLAHPLTHPLARPFIHPLTHPLTPSLARSPTHSLTHLTHHSH